MRKGGENINNKTKSKDFFEKKCYLKERRTKCLKRK
jgi:hypothetical protein